MLLGEVSEDPFQDSRVGMALFIVFMFLVVILLANVLIAIVTDSYKVIQVCFFFAHIVGRLLYSLRSDSLKRLPATVI